MDAEKECLRKPKNNAGRPQRNGERYKETEYWTGDKLCLNVISFFCKKGSLVRKNQTGIKSLQKKLKSKDTQKNQQQVLSQTPTIDNNENSKKNSQNKKNDEKLAEIIQMQNKEQNKEKNEEDNKENNEKDDQENEFQEISPDIYKELQKKLFDFLKIPKEKKYFFLKDNPFEKHKMLFNFDQLYKKSLNYQKYPETKIQEIKNTLDTFSQSMNKMTELLNESTIKWLEEILNTSYLPQANKNTNLSEIRRFVQSQKKNPIFSELYNYQFINEEFQFYENKQSVTKDRMEKNLELYLNRNLEKQKTECEKFNIQIEKFIEELFKILQEFLVIQNK